MMEIAILRSPFWNGGPEASVIFHGERMTKERLTVLIDLTIEDPIRLPTGWIVRRLGPERVWPRNPTRIVIELERKPCFICQQ
jgi:hypothetical protein